MTEKLVYDKFEKKLLKENPKLKGARRKVRQLIGETQQGSMDEDGNIIPKGEIEVFV